MNCPYCGSKKTVLIEKDDILNTKSHFTHCTVCGHDVQTCEQLDETLNKITKKRDYSNR